MYSLPSGMVKLVMELYKNETYLLHRWDAVVVVVVEYEAMTQMSPGIETVM